MDIDFYDDEIIVYIWEEEIEKLLNGHNLYKNQNVVYDEANYKKEITISPPEISKRVLIGDISKKEGGYYGDTLKALEEAFFMIEELKTENIDIIEDFKWHKIQNTYRHYKEQQDRYR